MNLRVIEGILRFIAPIPKAGLDAEQRPSASEFKQEKLEAIPDASQQAPAAPTPKQQPGPGLLGLSEALFQFSRKVLQKGRAMTRYGKQSTGPKTGRLERGKVIDENVD